MPNYCFSTNPNVTEEWYSYDDYRPVYVMSNAATRQSEYFADNISGCVDTLDNVTKAMMDTLNNRLSVPRFWGTYIYKIIFNDPATVLLTSRGKIVVKCFERDKYNWRTGFMLCLLKLMSEIDGNKYYEYICKYYHDKPSKMSSAIEGWLVGELGPEQFDYLMDFAKKVYKNRNKKEK